MVFKKFMLFIFLVHVPGPIVNDLSVIVISKLKDLSFVHSFVCLRHSWRLKGSEVLHQPLDLPDEMFLKIPKIH